MPRLLKILSIALFFVLFSLYLPPNSTAAELPQNRHPLRPQPDIITSEEKARTPGDPTQTLFCAQRPVAIETHKFDKRDEIITLQLDGGDYTSNFEEFVTPLLSVTNQDKSDFDLSFEEKAKRYLADYLGGRAYYELFCEDLSCPDFKTNLLKSAKFTPDQITKINNNSSLKNLSLDLQVKIHSLFILPRYGVFRKLAPQTVQDKYKRAMILRATANPSLKDIKALYGFTPATATVQNYPVTCWNGSQIVNFVRYSANFKNPCSGSQNIKLSHFDETNWAPIPQDFKTANQYNLAYKNWLIKDNRKWSTAWAYVPMFSRENVQGWIRVVGENTEPTRNPVQHPHLARTYELSTALNILLMPKNDYDFDSDPQLATDWSGKPWCVSPGQNYNSPIQCNKWWIDSSETMPELPLGYVCDPKDPQVFSSGDSAYDKQFITNVISPAQKIFNPKYQPNIEQECVKIKKDKDGNEYLDDSDCKFKQVIRYSPEYFVTKTPFLDQIANRLISSPYALFNIFRNKTEIERNPPENWPGLGNQTEDTPTYDYTNGQEEAGMKNPPDTVKFFYKGLGFIHCQKERILATLTPTGSNSYRPFSKECKFDFGSFNVSNVCSGELMAQLNPPNQTTKKASNYFKLKQNRFTAFLLNIYGKVEAQTGVPCEVLAGIHFRESDNLTGSLVSGRDIGKPEPDAGNKIFNTLEATAFHAAEELKNKVGLRPVNQPDQNFKDLKTLTTALTRYNGTGNSNCRSSYSCESAKSSDECNMVCRDQCNLENPDHLDEFVYPIPPLGFCPAKFTGDDSNYAVNQLDNQHDPMYILFCRDHTMCKPKADSRPGALPFAIEFYNNMTKQL